MMDPTSNMSNSSRSTSSTSSPRHHHHHVQFDLDNVVEHDIECIQDMSYDDKELKWFNQQDFDKILQDCEESFELMKLGEKNPEMVGHCYRGLEDRAQEEYNSKRKIKSLAERACEAVMKEQNRQRREEGAKNNPELLATIYAGYTTLCANSAVRQGTADRLEAKACYSKAPSDKEGNSFHTSPFRAGMELEVQFPACSGSGGDHDDDDSSIVSDVSIDPSIKSTKISLATSRVMGRIRKMIDRTRMPHPKHRTSV